MLNFLHNRPDQQKASITGINRKPAITYGMSAQSPMEFVKPYTMMSTGTYVNPHYKYEELRLSKLGGQNKNGLSSDWTRKTNINLVEEEKVIGINNLKSERNRSLYHDLYKEELAKGASRFRLTKGQFTNFLHQQRPLEGQQRTLQRARQTRKSILQESISSLQKLKSNPSLLSTHRTSTIWFQKRKLRKSRQVLHNSIKVELENRRYSKSPNFLLPKVYLSSTKKNKHKPTESQMLCQNYLNVYFKTIDVIETNRS